MPDLAVPQTSAYVEGATPSLVLVPEVTETSALFARPRDPALYTPVLYKLFYSVKYGDKLNLLFTF